MSLFSSAKKGDCFTTRGAQKVKYVLPHPWEVSHQVVNDDRKHYWVNDDGVALFAGQRWDITGPWRGSHEIPACQSPDTEEEKRGET